MMGEKQVREECKEPVFYTIDCNREELKAYLEGMKKANRKARCNYDNNQDDSADHK